MTSSTATRTGVGFTVALALVTVLGPSGTDMYLSSLPDIASEFSVPASTVQLTLTVFLFAMGAGQLIFGPIVDAYGRRRAMLTGIAGFVLTSLWAASASGATALISARFLQGLCAAVTLVVVISMVRDVAVGVRAAQLFALLMTIEGLAPVLAPTVGGFVDSAFGWRAVLLVLAAMGVVAFAAAAIRLKETLPNEARTPLRPANVVGTYWRIARDANFLIPALGLSSVFFVLFGYIGGATFVYQDRFGLGADIFGLVFGATGLAVMVGAIIAGRAVAKYGAARLALAGAVLLVAGMTVALASGATAVGLPGILAGMFLALIGVGIGESTLMALTMASQTISLGSTAALLGAFQLMISSAATPLAGALAEKGAVPWLLLLVGSSVISLAVVWIGARRAPDNITDMAAH
ncbi:MAG: multidrug effflux MFS transporter [Rhodococcus sp. (in: high G+C Gram-positive bacteria)]